MHMVPCILYDYVWDIVNDESSHVRELLAFGPNTLRYVPEEWGPCPGSGKTLPYLTSN